VGVVSYPRKNGKHGKVSSDVRRPHRVWADFGVFCAAVTLAAATVIGAVAAKGRPATRQSPIVTVNIAGTVNLFQDTGIQRDLRAHGFAITSTGYGASQIAAPRFPLTRFGIEYLPTQVAAGPVLSALGAEGVPNDAYHPFQSRLAVASYLPIAELLERIGITRQVGGIWYFNVERYVDAVDHGIYWKNVPGNRNGRIYGNNGPVVLTTTDPRGSALAQLFVADASYALNGDKVVTKQASVQKEISELNPCFTLQAANLDMGGGNPEFTDTYLKDGMNAFPLVLTYEDKYVSDELADRHAQAKLIKPNMVLMYLTPDIEVGDTLIGVTTAGQEVSQLFGDPRIQSIAENQYGFITTTQDAFEKAMAAQHITVAGPLTDLATPPDYSTLQSIIDHLP
jgi:hypothetical protein